jgi:hypothetical protein
VSVPAVGASRSATRLRSIRLAALLGALVSVELVILAANRCRCPLTAVAARYTP